MPFILFFPKAEQHDLLKEEVRLKFPNAKLSFSKEGLVSFKFESKDIDRKKISRVIYSRRVGLFEQKLNQVPHKTKNLDYIEIKEGEYWQYQILECQLDHFKLSEIEFDESAPSRSYLKMKEVHRFFKLNLIQGQQVLEIGSAPGGISYYLLRLGLNVFCIDPAQMEAKLQEDYPQNFIHLQKSIFDVEFNEVPKEIDWVVVDLNLKAEISVNQTLRFVQKNKSIKGVFLTLKTPKINDVAKILKLENEIQKKLNREIKVFQLPSHRREVGLLIV